MIKNGTEIGLFISKTICLALALILGTSLFAAGAFAELGCGEKCCCHRDTMDMHHSKGKQITLSAGLCNGNPMIPCDLETGQSTQLPDFVLFSTGTNQPNTVAPTGTNTDFFIDRYDSKSICLYQSVRVNSPSAPIYLQNSSFII
jgi:hypothetical protein